MASLHEEDNYQSEKIKQGAEGTHLSEPQKAHATGKFDMVA